MIESLRNYLVLPGPVSDFERTYLARMNRIGLWFFILHLPVFVAVAYFNEQSVLLAILLTGLLLVGPVVAQRSFESPRSVSLVYGFTAMLMGGLLVHFGQGPVQIEMHFYFFALLAMLAMYGNPMAIVVAAITVALHHLLLWAFLRPSVFNYDAPLWVVLVHAGFVVLESIATCFIARSFFDNVIGLEKIVQARTDALDGRNRDMRRVLDTVTQGLLTVDRELIMSNEKSAIVESWFGAPQPGQTLTEYLGAHDASFASHFSMGWDQVLADWLPLALTIDQLPKRLTSEGRYFSLQYRPIERDGSLERALVMISDISADVERERLEAEQHDVLQILRRVAKDKLGVLEFVSEACELVNEIVDPLAGDAVLLKRQLHTLKGNSMIFGVQTIAQLCHNMESAMEETNKLPSDESRHQLQLAWNKLCASIDMLLGSREHPRIEIDDADFEQLLRAVLRGESSEVLAELLMAWKLEPTARRLMRAAEQAQSIAQRLNKGSLRITIDDNALRLDPRAWTSFWAAFVHVVRNAVDHGIEPPESRVERGKPAQGALTLTTRIEQDELIIQMEDDGRGIDWQRVADKAAQLGLPYQTPSELTDALFADGMSTRSDVSEYSGRGVGMGVVRQAAQERGGFIRVTSQSGQGTRIAFHFPRLPHAPPLLQRAS